VNKDQATEETIKAIRQLLEGGVYLSEAVSQRMLRRAVDGHREEVTRSPLDSLSDPELEELRLICQGIKTAALAYRLNPRVKTLEASRGRIRQQLRLSDGTDLPVYAGQWHRENA